MPTNALRSTSLSTLVSAAAAIAGCIPATSFAAQHTTAQSAVVRSASGRVAERGDAATRDRSQFIESETISTERLPNVGKGDSTTAAALLLDEAWIYDASVEYFDDYDADGYYSFLRVTFDADSMYAEHWVYARLFLTIDGVRWEEYHVTGDFLIEGTSAFDAFEVETELVSGFAPGLYDVLIELYDADFGYFLGEYGPVQSSAFSLLPLEDIEYDTPPVVVVTHEHGGGGALGVPALLGLFALGAFARRKRRRLSR